MASPSKISTMSIAPTKSVLSFYNIVYRHNSAASARLGSDALQGIRMHIHNHSIAIKAERTYTAFFRYGADKTAEYACTTRDDEDSFVDFTVLEVSEEMERHFGKDPVRLEWLVTRDDFGLRFVRWEVGREGLAGWQWGFARMGQPMILTLEEGRRLGVFAF